jgi:hypothetical protein
MAIAAVEQAVAGRAGVLCRRELLQNVVKEIG